MSVVAFFSVLIVISLGTVGLIAAAGAGLAATGTMMCWPPARRLIIARWWWLVTPHRIRVGCARGWVQTLDGRLPIILSCTPAHYGERVSLWLPAGLTASRLRAVSEELAPMRTRGHQPGLLCHREGMKGASGKLSVSDSSHLTGRLA